MAGHPPGDGPPPPPRHAAPTGHAGQGDSVGPPHPHTGAHSMWVADPNSPGGQSGEGQRTTSDAPHNSRRHPPRGRPSATRTASNAGPQGRTLWGQCWAPTPTHPRPQHVGGGPQQPAQWAGSRGRDSACPQTPLTMVEGSPPGDALPPPPQRATPARKGARCGAGAGPHARTDRTRDTRVAEPRLPAPEDGRLGEGQRLTPDAPHNGGRHPPWGRPSARPHSEQRRPARAHAAGLVLGPHARTDRIWDTRVAEPRLPAPEDGRPGEGQRLTLDAPHNGRRHPPRGRPSATPTASNSGPQGRTLRGWCWVPSPAPTAPGTHGSRNPGCPLQRTGGRGRDSA